MHPPSTTTNPTAAFCRHESTAYLFPTETGKATAYAIEGLQDRESCLWGRWKRSTKGRSASIVATICPLTFAAKEATNIRSATAEAKVACSASPNDSEIAPSIEEDEARR